MGFFWEGISDLNSKTLICWLTLIDRSPITRFTHTQDSGLLYMFMESGWEVVEELTQFYQHRHRASMSMVVNNIILKDVWCDHNCRNVHNCRNQPPLSKHQPQLSQSWSTTIVVTPITNLAIFLKKNIAFLLSILYKIMTFNTIFSHCCFTSHS